MKQIFYIIILNLTLNVMSFGQEDSNCENKDFILKGEAKELFNSTDLSKQVRFFTNGFLELLMGITAKSESYDSVYWEILKLTSQDFRCQVFYHDTRTDQTLSRTNMVEDIRSSFEGQGFKVKGYCINFEEIVYLREFGVLRIPLNIEVLLPKVIDGNTNLLVTNSQKIKLRFVYSFDGLDMKLLSIQRASNIKPPLEISVGTGPFFLNTISTQHITGDGITDEPLQRMLNTNFVDRAQLNDTRNSGIKFDLRLTIPLADGKKYNIPVSMGLGLLTLTRMALLDQNISLGFSEAQKLNILQIDGNIMDPRQEYILINNVRESANLNSYNIGLGIERIWQFNQWKLKVNPSINLYKIVGKKHSLIPQAIRIGMFSDEGDDKITVGYYGGNLPGSNDLFNNYGTSENKLTIDDSINWLHIGGALATDLSYQPFNGLLSYFVRFEIGYLYALSNSRKKEVSGHFSRFSNYGLLNFNDSNPDLLQSSLMLGINFKLK